MHLQAKVRAAGVTEEGDMDGHPGSLFSNSFDKIDASFFISPINYLDSARQRVHVQGLIHSHSTTPVQDHTRYSAHHTKNESQQKVGFLVGAKGRNKLQKSTTKQRQVLAKLVMEYVQP